MRTRWDLGLGFFFPLIIEIFQDKKVHIKYSAYGKKLQLLGRFSVGFWEESLWDSYSMKFKVMDSVTAL